MSKPNFVKYASLEAILGPESINDYSNHEFEVFEKIDGGNCQVRKTGEWEITPGIRGTFLTGKRISKTEWFRRFLRWTYSNPTLYNLPSNLIMFGEWSGNHTIRYSAQNTDQFFLTDVFNLDSNLFLPYIEAKESISGCGIKGTRFLRTLAGGKIAEEDIKRMLLEEKSGYYEGSKEGLVFKDYVSSPQLFLKLHHPSFAEKRRLRSGEIDFLTPTRFRKNWFKLREEYGVDNVPIADLAQEVINDVYKEGGPSYDISSVQKRYNDYLVDGSLSDL